MLLKLLLAFTIVPILEFIVLMRLSEATSLLTFALAIRA